ncbi:hypothetical protein ABTZ57_01275 [Streptomyces sp. NPDC094048]|uniref:hypothetical protein n=1 Tax=unclassified Streptomyces TaxID=2593676 RepID=UPI0033307725
MFGLTTRAHLRDEVDAHLRTIRSLLRAEAETGLARQTLSNEIDAHLNTIRARNTAEDTLAQEKRITRRLAEQLLDATGTYPTAARASLGLPPAGPWERAVEGLNALVDAGELFHVEPDGHISNPCGDQHIEWDRTAERWRLANDDEQPIPAAVDTVKDDRG